MHQSIKKEFKELKSSISLNLEKLFMEETFNLSQWNIKRPLKVRWRVDLTNASSISDVLRSKSLRKMYRKLPDILKENNFSFQRTVLNREKFIDWLSFYEKKVEEHSYRKIASLEWFDERIRDSSIKLEIIEIFREKKRVSAGIVMTRLEPNEFPVLAFSASERFHFSSISNASLGAVLNLIFFDEMSKQGYKTISGGRSRNAFGFFNTLGYLEYKLRLGYTPFADDKSDFVTDVPLNEHKEACFFAVNEQDEFQLYLLLPKGASSARFDELYTAEFKPIVLQY